MQFFPSILSRDLTICHYHQQCYSALLSLELPNNYNYEKKPFWPSWHFWYVFLSPWLSYMDINCVRRTKGNADLICCDYQDHWNEGLSQSEQVFLTLKDHDEAKCIFPAGLENKLRPGLKREKCCYSLTRGTLGQCHQKFVPNSPTLHLSWNVIRQICNPSSREGEKPQNKPAAI